VSKPAPPDWAIKIALSEARRSPCAKSKRGAVLFLDDRETGSLLLGIGFNGPALGSCDGSESCRTSCSKRCVHAEARAVRWAGRAGELVHVKIDERGELAPGGGPSCWQCSREILDAGCKGVWLYEKTPDGWCPHADVAAADCWACQGHAGELDRHGDLPIVLARWRYYTATDFHRLTMAACEIHDPERIAAAVQQQRETDVLNTIGTALLSCDDAKLADLAESPPRQIAQTINDGLDGRQNLDERAAAVLAILGGN
jgi:deoxycytidylate deaminase